MIDFINNIFSNDDYRVFLSLLLAILGSFVLRPIPTVLLNLFQNYILIKFILLVFIGFRILHPINKKKLINIVISSIIILFILEILRKYD
jgi:hypothetical protein